jgi:hypothetical protein
MTATSPKTKDPVCGMDVDEKSAAALLSTMAKVTTSAANVAWKSSVPIHLGS